MNFEKLFNDYGVQYSLKVNRNWVNVRCPYCGGSSFKFGFSPAEDYCTCFACGGHNLFDSLLRLLPVKRGELRGVMSNYEGGVAIRRELNHGGVKRLELPTNGFTAAEKKYLEKRSFDPDYLHEKYGVVGGGVAGRWKHRIIVPILLNGRVVSWTGRSILSKGRLQELGVPRYKNLSIGESVVDPKRTLFNLDNCRGGSVILTEGVFDVMRFGDDAVCSFGVELTEAQIELIADKFKKVYILFDNEDQAQRTARKYGVLLSSVGVNVEVVDAYSDFGKKDGGELTLSEANVVRRELGFERV